MSLLSRFEKLLKKARKTQVAKSVLRVKHEDTPRARSLGVDVEGFEAAMARQRADARRAWAGSE